MRLSIEPVRAHHPAAFGNVGQPIRRDHPIPIGNKLKDGERESVTVAGPLGTPLDLIADRMEMARALPGDFAVVLPLGVYGLPVSSVNSPGQPSAVEILVH